MVPGQPRRRRHRHGFAVSHHRLSQATGHHDLWRATYAHLLGFARWPLRQKQARIDVLPDGGFKPGPKSMGVLAGVQACRFIKNETPTRTVVDPFCGLGTVLAVANALGLDAVGVDIAPRMCRQARNLQIEPDPGW